MPVTQQELDLFHRFAQAQIGSGDPPQSLLECLKKWRLEREHEETIEAIRAGLAESEAGLGIPLEEAAAQIRRELGWYETQS